MAIDLLQAEPGSIIAACISAPIGRDQLAAYAEASGDLNPLHLDPAFARKAGFDDVIVHGMLSMAILTRLLTDHLPAGSLNTLSARFVDTVPVGEALHCTARLDSLEFGTAVISLEAATSNGTIAVAATASASLR